MVTDSAALRAVALGPDGVIAGLRPGSVWAEMSTVSPDVTRELGHAVAERGAALIDAPVSGSAVTVEAGQLSFMVGGDPAALEKVRAHLLAIGPTITHVGELGLAVTMKIATNLGLAVQMLAFSEAVALAEKAGIVRERAVEVLLKSVIASPMVKYRGPFVLGMPPEALFNVDMIQKDLGLALEMGTRRAPAERRPHQRAHDRRAGSGPDRLRLRRRLRRDRAHERPAPERQESPLTGATGAAAAVSVSAA
jgi:3-hydroxyisobutyrate dehydrogenase-like beta-hydroxyacid dehydrogenase